jgi:hypothetical protein
VLILTYVVRERDVDMPLGNPAELLSFPIPANSDALELRSVDRFTVVDTPMQELNNPPAVERTTQELVETKAPVIAARRPPGAYVTSSAASTRNLTSPVMLTSNGGSSASDAYVNLSELNSLPDNSICSKLGHMYLC